MEGMGIVTNGMKVFFLTLKIRLSKWANSLLWVNYAFIMDNSHGLIWIFIIFVWYNGNKPILVPIYDYI